MVKHNLVKHNLVKHNLVKHKLVEHNFVNDILVQHKMAITWFIKQFMVDKLVENTFGLDIT